MIFDKNKWKSTKLREVCERVKTVSIRKQHGIFSYIDIGSIDSRSKRVTEVQEIDWINASPRARQVISKGDTLFSTVRVNLERIAYLDRDILNGIASTGFTILRANGKIDPKFLFYSIISPNFIDKISKLQKGTAYPAVSDKIVLNEEILLPGLDEQKKIASLFQSVEIAIEHTEKQALYLKQLEKSLVTGLVTKKPVFGNVINIANCTSTTFDAIAECDKTSPQREDRIHRFVGLENINTEDFQLQGWGDVANGTTFTKRFIKGDVLFGKRRAYLKKVAIADFDGLCSGDILVIRAKQTKILQGLLPFYISSDAFIQHAISTSAGSLSPRTKWKDLAELEVSIPDLKTQAKILEVLQQVESTKTQLKQQKIVLSNLKQKLLNEILG